MLLFKSFFVCSLALCSGYKVINRDYKLLKIYYLTKEDLQGQFLKFNEIIINK